jgi:hypothetical protein
MHETSSYDTVTKISGDAMLAVLVLQLIKNIWHRFEHENLEYVVLNSYHHV